MGNKKKPVRELTSDQFAQRLFPNEVVREAKKVAHERDAAGDHGKGRKAKKKK